MITPNTHVTPLNVDGAVVFWSVKKSEHDVLCSGLADLDLHDFQPDPRGTVAILKDALGEVYPGAGYKVDGLDTKDGYSITKMIKGHDNTPPKFEHVGNVTVTEGGTITFYSDTISFEEETLIREKYDVAAGHITAGQVTASLIKILTRLGGITLRPSGAVYWLPFEALEEWSKVVKVVEDAAIDGQISMVHVMRVSFDESSVRAVAEGLVSDVTQEAEDLLGKINKGIDSGKMKDATHKRYLQQTDDLRLKVIAYEDALGKSLTELHDKLQEITKVQTQGKLVATAT